MVSVDEHRDWIGERLAIALSSTWASLEVEDWITSIVAEVVSRYPVDGVQFDDYFYTESPGSLLNL
ncbi:family 10 glycosylhydrolase [Escherichia coli]